MNPYLMIYRKGDCDAVSTEDSARISAIGNDDLIGGNHRHDGGGSDGVALWS